MPTIGIDTDLEGAAIRPTADPHFLQTLDAASGPSTLKAVIAWPGGETVIEAVQLDGDRLDDSRVADELNRLARAGVRSGVTLGFKDDDSAESSHQE